MLIKKFKRLSGTNDAFQPLLLLAALVALVAALALYSDFFMTRRNWINILDNHMAHQLLLAIGMTFVISSGGIDLSSGAVLALSGIVLALTFEMGGGVPLAVAAALLSAAAMGAFNGLLAANFTINPLIITLGTASLFRGAAIIITGGTPFYGMPKEFLRLTQDFLSLPIPVWIALAALALSFCALRCTKWGLYVLVIGSDSEALRRLGVNVAAYKISVYALSGFLAGAASLIITARLSTAEATAGIGMEMNAITAVVLGGTLLKGGKGTITGTAVACLLLSVIKNGLTMMSVDAHYQEFIVGALLLSAVIITELRQKKLMPQIASPMVKNKNTK